MVEVDELVKLSQRLIKIPSEVQGIDYGREQEMADFVASRLENIGFEIKFQKVREGRPNIVAILKGVGRGRSLMLNGHLDTIESSGMTVNPYGGEVKDGKIYGRGAADMKGALAAMIIAGEAIARAGVQLDGDLIFTGCVDEEGRGLGSQYLATSGIHADMAIVGELTSLKIGIAHKGLTFIDIVTRGKAAHGSSPHYGVNAILAMNQIINALNKTLRKKLDARSHRLLGKPTFNIGLIHGGFRANVVPDRCRIAIDRRMIPGETYQSVMTELEEVLEGLRRKHRDLQVEATAVDWVKCIPMEISPKEYIVEAISKSMYALTGKRPEVTSVPYWCDASSLVNIAGIPTAVFGPGDLEQAHSATESIEIDKLTIFTKAIVLTALDVCGGGR